MNFDEKHENIDFLQKPQKPQKPEKPEKKVKIKL
jgi:hypothetical protein